jgi:hypothetical protein
MHGWPRHLAVAGVVGLDDEHHGILNLWHVSQCTTPCSLGRSLTIL